MNVKCHKHQVLRYPHSCNQIHPASEDSKIKGLKVTAMGEQQHCPL